MGVQRGDLSDLRGIPEENECQRRSCGEFHRKMSVLSVILYYVILYYIMLYYIIVYYIILYYII